MTSIDPTPTPFDVPAETSPIERARETLACAQTDAAAYLTDVRQGEAYVDPARGLAALRDAQVGTGHAVLALREELAATRQEISHVAEAVRELAAAVTTAAAPFPDAIADLGEQIAELRDGLGDQLGELTGELCTEVSELRADVSAIAVAAHTPARRRWFGRWSR